MLMAVTVAALITLTSCAQTLAFHENLGIDDQKASRLYQTNPNDPAIVQWKTALQAAINDMDKCFEVRTATLCVDLIPTILSNCMTHPNTLLACNDSRFPQYPTILNQSIEAQKRAEEEQKRFEEAQKEAQIMENTARLEEDKKTRPIRIQAYGLDMLNKCFISSSNNSSKFEIASTACNLEMGSLQNECQTYNNTLEYCKDERFVGYLKHNIMNSTLSP